MKINTLTKTEEIYEEMFNKGAPHFVALFEASKSLGKENRANKKRLLRIWFERYFGDTMILPTLIGLAGKCECHSLMQEFCLAAMKAHPHETILKYLWAWELHRRGETMDALTLATDCIADNVHFYHDDPNWDMLYSLFEAVCPSDDSRNQFDMLVEEISTTYGKDPKEYSRRIERIEAHRIVFSDEMDLERGFLPNDDKTERWLEPWLYPTSVLEAGRHIEKDHRERWYIRSVEDVYDALSDFTGRDASADFLITLDESFCAISFHEHPREDIGRHGFPVRLIASILTEDDAKQLIVVRCRSKFFAGPSPTMYDHICNDDMFTALEGNGFNFLDDIIISENGLFSYKYAGIHGADVGSFLGVNSEMKAV